MQQSQKYGDHRIIAVSHRPSSSGFAYLLPMFESMHRNDLVFNHHYVVDPKVIYDYFKEMKWPLQDIKSFNHTEPFIKIGKRTVKPKKHHEDVSIIARSQKKQKIINSSSSSSSSRTSSSSSLSR